MQGQIVLWSGEKMRSLNDIVSRNAVLALQREQKLAGLRRERLYKTTIARRMALRLNRPEKSIYRQLSFVLKDPPSRVWRLDYLEAFAAAIGIRPQELMNEEAWFEGLVPSE